jgi:hypothetical protein
MFAIWASGMEKGWEISMGFSILLFAINEEFEMFINLINFFGVTKQFQVTKYL